MRRNVIETVMAAVVLVVAAAFAVFAYSRSGVSGLEGYEVTVTFNSVDGLATGGDVRISGIKVGTVVDQQLDRATFLVTVRLGIARDVKLPTDTLARIESDGMLSDNYVMLYPGKAATYLGDGDEITRSRGPVNLADQIGAAIYGGIQGETDHAAPTTGGGPDIPSLSDPEQPAESGQP